MSKTEAIQNSPVSEKEAPLTEHLTELRRRILLSLGSIIVCAIFCYGFSHKLFTLLALPLEEVAPGTSLIFISYPVAFFTYIKLAIVAGIFVASPFIMYQMWAFISPALYPHERRWAIPFIFLSSLFFIGGALFGYFFIFPVLFKFLASYTNSNLKLMPEVNHYFALSMRLLLGFGFLFEFPLILIFLTFLGILSPTMLRKNRKYAILLIFIAAAILTPTPDIVHMILVAVPLIILYEISLLLMLLVGDRTKNKQEEES